MKDLIKKILKESEDEFDWIEGPYLDDRHFLEEALRYLLKENGFNLIPTYITNGKRYLTINDMYTNQFGEPMQYGSHGRLYYVFPYELFSKEYLKSRMDEHNSKFPTPDTFRWAPPTQRQFYYDKYKLIEQVIRSIIE